MLKEYIYTYSQRRFYTNPYRNPYFGSYQMQNNQPNYMQPAGFYPPGMFPPSGQMLMSQPYQQQPPQFNPYLNQIPQPNPVPNKSSKSDSESDSESDSKSDSESESSEKHHRRHKKDKKKSKKDKKSKDKKSKEKKVKGKKAKKGKKKVPKVTSITPMCTCAVTQHKYIRQKWYHCRTCDLTGGNGCCEYCANTCHKEHDVYYEYTSGSCFCDCFDTGNCKLLPPTDLRCTFEITGGVAVEQPMYQCDDCGITDDQYICQNCALSKHSGHSLSLAEDVHGKVCHHYTNK